jgi:uncharacterized protein YodC (DUF2158 family)
VKKKRHPVLSEKQQMASFSEKQMASIVQRMMQAAAAASADTFKAGDVVCLREHGGPMTVEKCDGERVWCVWFGIDRFSRWTGPYRRLFRRGEIELTTTWRDRANDPIASQSAEIVQICAEVARLERTLVAAYTEVEVLKADRDRLSVLKEKSA